MEAGHDMLRLCGYCRLRLGSTLAGAEQGQRSRWAKLERYISPKVNEAVQLLTGAATSKAEVATIVPTELRDAPSLPQTGAGTM